MLGVFLICRAAVKILYNRTSSGQLGVTLFHTTQSKRRLFRREENYDRRRFALYAHVIEKTSFMSLAMNKSLKQAMEWKRCHYTRKRCPTSSRWT